MVVSGLRNARSAPRFASDGSLPIGPDRVPAVAQPLLIGVAFLRGDRGERVRMLHREREAGRRAVVEDIDGIAIEADDLGEAVDRGRDLVEAMAAARHVGVAESRQVWGNDVEAIGQERDEVAEHVAGADTAIDWIADGEGYLSWLEQGHLVPGDVLRDMRARALPGELDRVADQARSLREWFRDFVRQHKGRPLTAAALAELEPLNRLLERNESFCRIAPQQTGQGPFELQTVRRWRNPDALLLPVGEALARLVGTGDCSNLNACEIAGCTLLLSDHTRGHGPRWSCVATAGNYPYEHA